MPADLATSAYDQADNLSEADISSRRLVVVGGGGGGGGRDLELGISSRQHAAPPHTSKEVAPNLQPDMATPPSTAPAINCSGHQLPVTRADTGQREGNHGSSTVKDAGQYLNRRLPVTAADQRLQFDLQKQTAKGNLQETFTNPR